jgi:hypothetical protein
MCAARCARPCLEGRIVGVELRRLRGCLELHVLAIVRSGESEFESYVIGAELAAAIRRETYNLYRSLDIKGVVLEQATAEQFRWLVATGVVRSSAHSATLVPLALALQLLGGDAESAWHCLLTVVAEEVAAC